MSDVAGPGAVLAVVLKVMEDLQDPVRGPRGPLRPRTQTGLGPAAQGVVRVGLQVCRRHAFAVR